MNKGKTVEERMFSELSSSTVQLMIAIRFGGIKEHLIQSMQSQVDRNKELMEGNKYKHEEEDHDPSVRITRHNKHLYNN